ncbi:MAG: hypothetical protein OSJ61_03125 [Lachnospiraceae bacterium]|nr:hypothetical protein [Lachnospiraceae bacterium]
MEQPRTKNVIRNLLSAFLTGIIGTLLPFFVRTYTIKYLGSEYMGLGNLCSSILYVLSATDLGVANAFAYRLYKPIAEGNKEEVCRLLGFYKRIYLAIGLVIFCVGIAILPFFKCFISQNIPDDVNVYLVFFLYLLNTVISYSVFAYKNLIFSADQRKDYESMTTTITFGILYLGQIILIRMRLYYLSVCLLPISTFICNMLRNWIATCKYPDYVPRGNISRSEATLLKKDIFSVAIYKFRDISRNAFDNIVISTFAGLIVLSNYQNYYMVLTVPVWMLSILYMSILPSVGNFAVSNSQEEMYGIYKKNTFILSFLSAWFAICYCFLIQDFIVVWLGVEFRLSWTAAVLFSVYIYLHGEAMNIKIMRESIGLWNQGRIWAGIEMVTNILLNVILIIWMGVEGIILATILSILLISIPVENRIIFRQYFEGKGIDKVKSMLINVIWTVCTAAVVGVLCGFASHIQYISFVYKVCVCMLIPPLSCMLCFYHTEEFRFVKDILVSMIRRH